MIQQCTPYFRALDVIDTFKKVIRAEHLGISMAMGNLAFTIKSQSRDDEACIQPR